ncbi:hypothetical protein LTR04_004904, partial [Oleoguttula sp. CCFEE 6159]
AVCEFNDAHGIAYFKADVFRFFKVSPRSAYRAISTASNRRLSNILDDAPETRGRPPKIKKDDVVKSERMLEDGGVYTEGMSWQQLAHAAGFEHVHWRTIRNHIEETDFHQCVACPRSWVSPHHGQKRFQFAQLCLSIRPSWEDWKHVRFSSAVHFGLAPEGNLKIIRRPGERCCVDCIQGQKASYAKRLRRFHCWVMVGWNYKSILVFYKVPGNSNGKLSQKVYIEQILEPHVKPCLLRGEQFVLEEEADLGHGSGDTNNTVRQWKQDHGLQYYFSCAKSPDLSIVERCWRPVEQFLAADPQLDDQSAINTIVRGWQEHVSQDWINRMVMQFPETLQEVYQTQGRMTGN